MKKLSNYLPFLISIMLFIIPFFWLKPGFVDMGGDSDRLYFVEPLANAKVIATHKDWYLQYSMIPYELYLHGLQQLIESPTNLINFERGLQLSVSFLAIYLIISELTANGRVAITSGFVYLSLIAKSGWTRSLITHNQVFLNPLIFYLLLRFFKTKQWRYGIFILVISLLYSGNFGFSASYALLAFYPLAILYIAILKRINWKLLFSLGALFLVIHSFHLVPLVKGLFENNSTLHRHVMTSAGESAIRDFEASLGIGKISTMLLQPSILVPLAILIGFIIAPTSLMAATGLFFMLTLFLVSGNITNLGVSFYKLLFHIPGFLMFRIFYDKFYYLFAFFYVMLFSLSIKKIAKWTVCIIVITILLWGMRPLLQGELIYTPYYQSKNVSSVFKLDPNFLITLSYIKTLPTGKFLTLPLTFPGYQILYGSEGGAYVGPSIIMNLAGRDDYTGFWSMGNLQQSVFDALRANDTDSLLTIFRELGIKYVFYNSDVRIMDNFPDFPYIYPGIMYSSKDQVPVIRDQKAYQKLLAGWPLSKLYARGFYTIYEINYSDN